MHKIIPSIHSYIIYYRLFYELFLWGTDIQHCIIIFDLNYVKSNSNDYPSL